MRIENIMCAGSDFQLKHMALDYHDPEAFNRLQWTNKRWPFVLYRLLVMLYSVSWLAVDLVTNKDPIYYAYVSHWTEILQCYYFISAFVAAVNFSLKTSKRNAASRLVIGERLPVVHRLNWLLFNMAGGSSIGVAVLYWSGRIHNMVGVSQAMVSVVVHVHVTCCVLTIIELLLTDLPIAPAHAYHLPLFSLAFLLFTLALHWCGIESSVYPVLDWSGAPGVAALCAVCGVLLVSPILHLIVYGFFRLRKTLYAVKSDVTTAHVISRPLPGAVPPAAPV